PFSLYCPPSPRALLSFPTRRSSDLVLRPRAALRPRVLLGIVRRSRVGSDLRRGRADRDLPTGSPGRSDCHVHHGYSDPCGPAQGLRHGGGPTASRGTGDSQRPRAPSTRVHSIYRPSPVADSTAFPGRTGSDRRAFGSGTRPRGDLGSALGGPPTSSGAVGGLPVVRTQDRRRAA